jgi:hypothetical protein
MNRAQVSLAVAGLQSVLSRFEVKQPVLSCRFSPSPFVGRQGWGRRFPKVPASTPQVLTPILALLGEGVENQRASCVAGGARASWNTGMEN